MYSFGVDVLSLGDAPSALPNGSATHGTFPTTLEADSSPMSISGTYMLQPDTWELGVRYQDLDNSADESRIDVAVINHLDGHNWSADNTLGKYFSCGYKCKWVYSTC